MPIKIVDKRDFDNLPSNEQQVSMTKEIFDEMVSDFRERVRLKTGGELLEKDRSQYMLWHELHELVEALGPVDPVFGRGIKIHFGIDGDQLHYALNVFKFTGRTEEDGIVTLEYDLDAVRLPDFLLKDKKLEPLDAGQRAAWEEGMQRNYVDHVEIKHDGFFESIGPIDTLGVILPWELEVLQLYRDNEHDVADLIRPYVRISSICGMRSGEDGGIFGFRHGTALNMARFEGPVPENFINNENYVSLFTYRAADYGNLCPPRCAKYVVPPVLI